MEFSFNEVDASLNLKEFLLASVGGISLIVLPLLFKIILLHI